MVHRRTHLKPNGELAGDDQTGVVLPPISVAEQDAISRYATALSEVLIKAMVNQRRLNAMAWYLDALDSHHGCGYLGATEPATIIVKVIDDLQPSSSGHWHVDDARLHAHLRGQGLHPTDADAELHSTDKDHDVIYAAHVEEVPDAIVDVDPAAPPSWLRRL